MTHDPELLKAGQRRRDNRRRALKLAAEIAGPVSAETYAAILASGPCVYCGCPAEHVDHVRALSRGGAEHESNLVPACASCNLSKKHRLLTEWDLTKVAYGVAHNAIVAAEYQRLAAEGQRCGGKTPGGYGAITGTDGAIHASCSPDDPMTRPDCHRRVTEHGEAPGALRDVEPKPVGVESIRR